MLRRTACVICVKQFCQVKVLGGLGENMDLEGGEGCFLCCVFSVVYCSVILNCSLSLLFFCVLYCSLFLYCAVSAWDVLLLP
jgi:hypothetical protein